MQAPHVIGLILLRIRIITQFAWVGEQSEQNTEHLFCKSCKFSWLMWVDIGGFWFLYFSFRFEMDKNFVVLWFARPQNVGSYNSCHFWCSFRLV